LGLFHGKTGLFGGKNGTVSIRFWDCFKPSRFWDCFRFRHSQLVNHHLFRHPLRFRESDFAMAVKLLTQGNIMELYKLAIRPLIIENETTPQKAQG